jgi:hypothetical protein
LCQYNAVFIAMALVYIVKSGIAPVLLLLLSLALAIGILLSFQMNFRDDFFLFLFLKSL